MNNDGSDALIPSRALQVVGDRSLNDEQIALCSSDEFWTMISARRREGTMSRAELEQLVAKE